MSSFGSLLPDLVGGLVIVWLFGFIHDDWVVFEI